MIFIHPECHFINGPNYCRISQIIEYGRAAAQETQIHSLSAPKIIMGPPEFLINYLLASGHSDFPFLKVSHLSLTPRKMRFLLLVNKLKFVQIWVVLKGQDCF